MSKQYKPFAEDHSSPYMHAASYATACGTLMKPILGMNNYTILIEFKNSTWRYCCRMAGKESEWDELGRLVLLRLEDPKFLDKVYVEETAACMELLARSKKLRDTPLSKKPNPSLADLYDDLLSLWRVMNVWGDIVNLSDFDHFMLTNKIMGFLERAVDKSNSDISAGEAFGLLGTPTERSFMQQEEFELYGILANIQKDRGAMAVFSGEISQILAKLPELPQIYSSIKRHVERFDWLSFHYDGPTILKEDYFVDILRSEIKQGIDGKRKTDEMLKHFAQVQEDQMKMANSLKLSKGEIYWLKVARTFSFLKGLRKDAVFIASRNSDALVREIGRRLQLSPRQVRHMVPEEVRRGLEAGSFDPDILNERISHCVFIANEAGPRILSGKGAQQWSKMIIEEKVDGGIKELKGTPAYPGHAIGLVKLIRKAQDMVKMNKGDILVSPATNPNVVPAMKKAAAIVTDEGGVTCHAAIVSRELKIPCVIGTKIATKVLKDGDKVEVDATKGIVRKLN
ncbi:MAG: PEP-utilizing enzyme [Candidatus Micrarchaeota archaeon]